MFNYLFIHITIFPNLVLGADCWLDDVAALWDSYRPSKKQGGMINAGSLVLGVLWNVVVDQGQIHKMHQLTLSLFHTKMWHDREVYGPRYMKVLCMWYYDGKVREKTALTGGMYSNICFI